MRGVLFAYLTTASRLAVGVEADAGDVDRLLKELEGKDLAELIAAGREKLQSVPSGGGGAAAPAAGGAAAGGAAPAKKEEKKEEPSEEDEVSLHVNWYHSLRVVRHSGYILRVSKQGPY